MNQATASAEQLPLKKRLLAYFQKHPHTFIASGDIQRMVTEKTTYTASNATRRLRELHEEGEIKRELRKGHAYYAYVPHHTKRVYDIEIVDGVAVQTFKDIIV